MQRRRFLHLSALTTASAAFSALPAGSTFLPQPVVHIGVQLWSVREAMLKDAAATVQNLAKTGYREVEAYGYENGKIFGLTLPDFMKLLEDNGITMPSIHKTMTLSHYNATTKDITDSLKKDIDDLAARQVRYVVCPYIEEKERGSIEQLIGLYRAAADYCTKAGVHFAYHNHDFEYSRRGPDGRLLIEWLLHELDPAKVTMEMDFYWVTFAGYNPIDWFKAYPGRWALCHLKDMARTEKRETIEVGDGFIDFASILKWSKKAGLRYHFIELENYVTTPLEGVKKALNQFKKVKY